jgi:predicted MFS family arabinose efflux permease
MFAVNGFLIGSWAPQIPLFLARLQINESTLGLLILGFGLGALLAMPTAGYIIGRTGSRTTLVGFALACAFGLVVVVAAPSVWSAALAMVLFGGLIGGMDVSMNANAVAVERQLGRAIMSSSHGFWSLGGFAGGGAGGLAIERFGALGHAGIVTALALVAVVLVVPRLGGDDRPEPHERTPLVLPRDPILYLVGLVALFSMIPEGAVLDWAALYLREERGASIATAGFAFAAFSAAMALMRFLGDRVRDRFGAVRTLRVSALIAAVGMVGAGLAPEAWMVIAAFCIAGVGIANTVPIAFSAGGNHPGLPPGAGMSVVTSMGYSGILVAPSVLGFVGQHFGFAPVFIGAGLLLLFVAALAGHARAAD